MNTRHHVQRSFRNVFRRFVVLGAGLLIVALPGSALAQDTAEDDDPFDRPGFYMGLGGSYQMNFFESQIEDELQDATVSDAQVDIDDSGGINATVGYRAASFFAIELEYEWIDEYDIKAGSNTVGVSGGLYSIEGHTLTANTKWIIPFWRIQPYLLLGGGLAVSDVDRGNLYDGPLGPILEAQGVDVDDGNHTNAAGRAGLGLDLYITESLLVNAEAGVVVTTLKEPDLDDIDDLNYMSFAAGLQYRF